MPNPGNSPDQLIAYYPGSPSGVSTSILNTTLGSLIIDYTTPAVFQRTSATLNTVVQLISDSGSQTLTNKTLTAPIITTPTIDGVAYSVLNNRQVVTVAFNVSGAALHAAVLNAVTFPAAAVILRAWLDITTVSTGACTIDVGYSATSATTSDTLLDGVDANASVALFDSMDATLDTGANAHAQKAASGKFVTIDEKTGDSTGMTAVLYVQFVLA